MTNSRPAVGQIHITVTDLDRSIAFYRDVLGLEHLFTVPGQPMSFFDAGGVRLYLGRTEDERFVSRPTIYYRVDDLDTSWAEITARGAAEISGPQLVHRDGPRTCGWPSSPIRTASPSASCKSARRADHVHQASTH